jgi:ADP-heptose:LPS heptosyltransferase
MDAVCSLLRDGWRVVLTGGAHERPRNRWLAAAAGGAAVDLTGRLRFGELAALIAAATAVVVGNTGPMHLAAAVGTPVACVFAPVVPLDRWRPWMVPAVVLGRQQIECALCRARTCPRPVQECTSALRGNDVALAVAQLARSVAPA